MSRRTQSGLAGAQSGKEVCRVLFAPGRRSYQGVTMTRPTRHLVLAILAGFAVAGCSSSASSRATSPAPTTITSPPSTATTLDPAEQAVLAAYRRYWDMYIAVGSEMKLPDPRLAEVATGEELRQLNGAFLADKAAGQVLRGSIDLAPAVVERATDRALVRDCQASQILVVDRASGRPLGPAPSDTTLITATMLWEQNAWKVAGIRHEGDGCTPER